MASAHETRIQRIRESGNKLTRAREVVLQALESFEGHPSSTDILDIVETLDESVGRASVFRALDLFTQLSIIRPTVISSGTTRTTQYVLMPDGHHHHIVCLNCQRTIEFDDCDLDKLQHELEARMNVILTGHLLEFYGFCSDCHGEAV